MHKLRFSRWVWGFVFGGLLGALWVMQGRAQAETITVYRNPQCQCCERWAEHLREHGFTVDMKDVADMAAIKTRYGVPPALRSCHTALIGGYVVEGHVPADQIERLLRERPAIKGIAVPGMPQGSPGMEGAKRQHYDVLSFDGKGGTRVYDSR